jgi:hypothetical protein
MAVAIEQIIPASDAGLLHEGHGGPHHPVDLAQGLLAAHFRIQAIHPMGALGGFGKDCGWDFVTHGKLDPGPLRTLVYNQSTVCHHSKRLFVVKLRRENHDP